MSHPEEDGLLGCILAGADPAGLDLTPEQFYDPRNEWIYRACLEVAAGGVRCDPQTVALALGPQVHKIPDGPLHLVTLAQNAIPANAPAFAARVREGHERRTLVAVAHRIMQQAEDPEKDPHDLREDARTWLDHRTSRRGTAVTLGDLLPAFIDRVENGAPPGLLTPWPDLDHHLHGLHPGRLYTVGGRPGAGKSVLLSNVAAYFAGKHSQRVYYATLEMPRDELLGRIVAATAGISQTNLLTGAMSENDWDRLNRHHNQIQSMDITVCDDSTQSLQSIRAGARDAQRRGGLGLVVVDYLQLIAPADRRPSRQQQIGDITRGLKAMSKELGVPVLTASQLRRPPNAKEKPTMNDLRESGDIEADSDVILLLHAEDEQKPWDLVVDVAKNRAGSKGPVRLMFDTTRALMNSTEWRHTA